MGRRPVGGYRTPVMGDQDRVPLPAEGVVQRSHVGGQRVGAEVAVRGYLGAVAPHEYRYRVVALSGQFWQQVTVTPGRIGEPVEAQRQRPGARHAGSRT
jgi:hypothetical protein